MQRRPALPSNTLGPFATRTPAAADLRQDIADAIPTDLVQRWRESDRSAAAHEALLAPFLVQGTIVSSDSAGLSKLTQRYALPQVLKLVSEPKEILHALSVAIGGVPIGVWAADNTQLFFPESIPAADVVDQLLEAQRRIAKGAVQIGIAAHFGPCYALAGGLFGPEADAIEEIAEDVTRGGEILLTQAMLARLEPDQRERAAPCTPDRAPIDLWNIAAAPARRAVDGADYRYPAPFPASVLELLRSRSLDALAGERLEPYRSERAVVFLKTRPRSTALLLDTFSQLSAVDTAVRALAASVGGDAVKSTGSLAIVLFDRPQDAVRFAREALAALDRADVDATAGVTSGPVLVFDLGSVREIAGDPVNLGSKLAEDSGLSGVLVQDTVTRALDDLESALGPDTEPFTIELSGVRIEGTCAPPR